MRNIKGKIILPVTVVFSLACIWLACSKNEKNGTCTTCRSKPPELIKNITISEQDFSVGIYKKTKYANLVLAKTQNENEETSSRMQDLVLALNKERSFDKFLKSGYIPVNYNIYAEANLKTADLVNAGSIKAISIFMYKDNGLHHFLFSMNQDGQLDYKPEFSTVSDRLRLYNKYLLFERLAGNNSNVISLITMVAPAYTEVMDKIVTEDKLEYRLRRRSPAQAKYITIVPFNDDDKCDPDVCDPIQDTEAECVEVIGGSACQEEEDKPLCGKKAVAKAYNKSTEFSTLDDAFYTLKYYVLEESVNGKKVIDNYYKASGFIKNHLLEIDLAKAYGFITLMHEKVCMILADTESKNILFDSETRDKARSFLSQLKAMDESKEWAETVEWLDKLLAQYANKSVDEVFKYLNS